MERQPVIRYFVHFTQEQESRVKFLLRQTTNLWNCIITYVGTETEALARSSSDPEIPDQIKEIIALAYQFLVERKDIGIDFNVSADWKSVLNYVREVPESALVNRVNDLISAYHRAHVYIQNNKDKTEESVNEHIPTFKSKTSTKTVRFNSSDYSVIKDVVKIKLKKGSLEFQVHGLDKVDFSIPHTLTITKKRPSRSRAEYPGEEVSRYFITLCPE